MSSLPKPQPLAVFLSDDRLADDATTLLRDAAGEATRLGHHLISGEHLLIAMISSGTPAGDLLRTAGATAEQARSRIEFVVPREPPFLLGGALRVAPRLVALLEDEGDVAASRDGRVESLDLLLALLRDGDGLPHRVLEECGVNTRALAQRASVREK